MVTRVSRTGWLVALAALVWATGLPTSAAAREEDELAPLLPPGGPEPPDWSAWAAVPRLRAESVAELTETIDRGSATSREIEESREVTRAVLIAIDHVILQDSMSGLKSREDWQRVAAGALQAALPGVLAERAGMSIVERPALEAEEAVALNEHAALAGLVLRVRDSLGGSAWHTRKESFDHGIGTGLAFLGERAGARYGVVLTGWQVEHSPGAVVTSVVLNVAGVIMVPFAGNRFLAGVYDLASGQLLWSDSISGAEVLGVGSPDLRDPGSAQEALAKVFESFTAPPIEGTAP